MKTVRVKASGSYEIRIGSGLLRTVGSSVDAVPGAKRAFIVSDDRVADLYLETVRKGLAEAGLSVGSFVFSHGERSKTLKTYEALLETLSEHRLTRSDVLYALGGGVVGDLTGFAAATFLRGIRYVQLSTTLLSAVDSSVGGKTAVDLKNGKNQVGAFHQPSLVLIDTDTLATLPEEELRCGYAETIKYGAFGDAPFFAAMEKQHILSDPESTIFRAVSMKRDIVERDEFDTGERMVLNFGHTFGHAVEKCSNYTVLHGQAVAMGMAAVTRASHVRGFCDGETVRRMEAILRQYGLPTKIPYALDDMADAVLSDKKMAGTTLRLIVPEAIGRVRIENVPAEEIRGWLSDGGVR